MKNTCLLIWACLICFPLFAEDGIPSIVVLKDGTEVEGFVKTFATRVSVETKASVFFYKNDELDIPKTNAFHEKYLAISQDMKLQGKVFSDWAWISKSEKEKQLEEERLADAEREQKDREFAEKMTNEGKVAYNGMWVTREAKAALIEYAQQKKAAVAPRIEQKNVIKAAAKTRIIEISARELMQAYKANEVDADVRYKDKTLVVSGTVDNIKKDIFNTLYITLETGEFLSSIQCYFDDSHEKELGNIQKGQSLTIKGNCGGLLGNVSLKDCEIR